MSNALNTAALLEGIRLATLTAWGSIPISYGPPRVPITSLPYGVVTWNRVEVDRNGPGSTVGRNSQKNLFTILGRFPFPADPTEVIDLQKVNLANSLIAQLQTGPEFASIGLQPLVISVDSGETDRPSERAFEVTLTFEVFTVADHS